MQQGFYVEIVQDDDGLWRWQLVDIRTGEIQSYSDGGYPDREHAHRVAAVLHSEMDVVYLGAGELPEPADPKFDDLMAQPKGR